MANEEQQHRRRWRLTRTTVYPAVGILVLWHQVFVAASAQPQLLFVAVVLLGLPIPIGLDQARKAVTAAATAVAKAGDDHGTERGTA